MRYASSFGFAVLATGMVSAASCGGGGGGNGGPTQPPGGGPLTIQATASAFVPNNPAAIPVGTTVTWTLAPGAPGAPHTVTPNNPQQAGVFAHRELTAANPTYSHTFTQAGTYDYHCEPHVALGMTGRIVVQ